MKIALFGANGATRNRGVAALATSTVTGIRARVPDADITWYDDGWGLRPDPDIPGLTHCGARLTRRYHRPESYHNMYVSAALGGLTNPGAVRLNAADAVLDTSGGDSFTDMYNPARWRLVNWPKRLAVARRRPLIMLPQTYGPFRHPTTRREAREFVSASACAWARDPDSFEALVDLLGPRFDPQRHRQGVDLAFALEPQRYPSTLDDWIARDSDPIAILNLSGLMLNPAEHRFGIRADVSHVIDVLAEKLLADGARLLFIPHVLAPGTSDDDERVTAELATRLSALHGPDRVATAPTELNSAQAKWLISRGDWLCAMRMHAAIAALSTGVPASCIAYSDKAGGVFATAGQRHRVVDARTLETDELLKQLWAAWEMRAHTRSVLRAASARVNAAAQTQLDDLVAVISGAG